jgi:hypothetical protein
MEPMHYIGLDVHKRKISYCVKDSDGKVYSEGSLSATRLDLDFWMKTPPQPWSAAMEATMLTGWIYDHLNPHAAQDRARISRPARPGSDGGETQSLSGQRHSTTRRSGAQIAQAVEAGYFCNGCRHHPYAADERLVLQRQGISTCGSHSRPILSSVIRRSLPSRFRTEPDVSRLMKTGGPSKVLGKVA